MELLSKKSSITLNAKLVRLGYVLLKLDLQKAFDRREWSFIRQALHYLNFPPNIIKLIMSCVSTSSIYILINDTHTPFFSPSRGIRQCDSLSPCLFILCMELLTKNIDMTVDYQLRKPIRIARNGPTLSHLFFADDIIFTATVSTKVVIRLLTSLMNLILPRVKKSTLRNQKYSFPKTVGDVIRILS